MRKAFEASTIFLFQSQKGAIHPKIKDECDDFKLALEETGVVDVNSYDYIRPITIQVSR